MMCLCLKMGNGIKPDSSMEMMDHSASHGSYMMLNGGVFRSAENGFVSLPISTECLPEGFCLELNCGEMPRQIIPTKLSDVLEQNTDPRYLLSAKACQGILNRSEKRNKKLPKELEAALKEQINAV